MKRRGTLFKIITFFCTLHSISGAELRCYNGSDSYTVISLDNPNSLMNSSCNHTDRTTVILTHGFIQKLSDNSLQLIIDAYSSAGNVNVLGLSWSAEAGLGTGGLLAYPTAASNTVTIGKQLGQYLVQASNVGCNVSSLHLIGFSLGAQLMGSAGREMKKENITVPRITGLDPAGPLFSSSLSELRLSFEPLDTHCATFVDVIHANPGVLGTSESIATVDIWVNCDNKFQPGCEDKKVTSIGVVFPSDICSHLLACAFFAKTVERGTDFIASYATDCVAWQNGEPSNQTIYLGENINQTASGIFYLAIKSSTEEYQTTAADQENYEFQKREVVERFSILSSIASFLKNIIPLLL